MMSPLQELHRRQQRVRLGSGLIILLATVLLLAGRTPALLHLSFETRGDPHPHQMAVRAEFAGACAGIIISWSSRAARDMLQ